MAVRSKDKNDRKTIIRYETVTTDLFSKNEIIKLIENSVEFNELITSGNYFFFQNRLWLCHREVIDLVDNQVAISKTALSNRKDFCLSRSYKSPIHSNSLLTIKRNIFTRFKPPRHSKTIFEDRRSIRHKLNQDNIFQAPSTSRTKRLRKFNENSNLIQHLQEWDYKERNNKILSLKFFNAKRVDDCNEDENHAFNELLKKLLLYTNDKSVGYGGDDGGDDDNKNYFYKLLQLQTFGELFAFLMERYGFTEKSLSDITQIPEKTISRMKTNKTYKSSLDYIVICCVAMKLLPWESYRLIQLAGRSLRTEKKVERCFMACIYVLYIFGSLDRCDILFKENGLAPLTSIIKKNKEKKKNQEK